MEFVVNTKFILIITLFLCYNLCADEIQMQALSQTCEPNSQQTDEKSKSNFVVISRGYLKPGRESANQSNRVFTIQPFDSKYQSEVVDLIERIQVGEFSIPIEEGQRKELQSISRNFQKNKGNYWVALLNGKVIGTIAVIDIGHNAFELRDVFLDKEYRGKNTGFAKKLLDTVLNWSREHDVKTIYLGTTLAFRAAHRFYEKHGFREVARKDMPSYCEPMDCDEKFYQLDL